MIVLFKFLAQPPYQVSYNFKFNILCIKYSFPVLHDAFAFIILCVIEKSGRFNLQIAYVSDTFHLFFTSRNA